MSMAKIPLNYMQKQKTISIIAIILAMVIISLGIFAYARSFSNSKRTQTPTLKDIDNLELSTNFGKVDSKSYLTDLNKDGKLDLLLYPSNGTICGTGGCPLYVFENENNDGTFTLVGYTSIVQGVYLANTYTNGWRDIVIVHSGGGANPELVKYKFDGKKYFNDKESTAIQSLPMGPQYQFDTSNLEPVF